MTTDRRVRIAIMGFTEHMRLAPFDHPEWEIWGLNDLYYEMPTVPADRVRWFQLHNWERPQVEQRPDSPTDFTGGPPHPRDPNHVLWLAETAKACPVYLMNPAPECPDALTFPRDEVLRYFDDGRGNPVRYFTNSISWMLGLAIMELCPESNGRRPIDPDATIGVFGVDMMVANNGAGSEYGWQRPSCEWLLGWARGCGITIVVPKESDLLKTAFQYGDEHGEYFRHKMAKYRAEMSNRRGQVTNQLNQAQMAHAELSGAINAVDYFLRSHMPGDPGEEPTLGRVPQPNSHKELSQVAPGVTDHGVPYDNGEG